jgi:hypothetical protein
MEEAVQSESGVKTLLLRDHGANLPLGLITHDSSFAKGFATRPWRMKEEKELSRQKKDNQGSSMAQYVSMVLSTMCSSIGNHNFDAPDYKDDHAKRRVIVSQMYMGDVFYVYAYLRREAIGNEMAVKITCRRCTKDFDYAADIGTLEIRTADALEPLCWDYTLRHPITIRGKTVKSFRMCPPRWSAMENIAGNPSEGLAKEVTILGSIAGLNGESGGIMLTASEIQELSKYDIEEITSGVDKHFLGPKMALELDGSFACPHCEYRDKRLIPIDWRYDNFFSTSSQ